jgi:hypothetical protein
LKRKKRKFTLFLRFDFSGDGVDNAKTEMGPNSVTTATTTALDAAGKTDTPKLLTSFVKVVSCKDDSRTLDWPAEMLQYTQVRGLNPCDAAARKAIQ